MSTSVVSDGHISEAYRARSGLCFEPNAMQREMYRRITSDDCAVLLKAPTGSGKTEAVVVPALDAGRRLFLIYPARSLLQDQEIRISHLLQHCSSRDGSRVYSLVVDTGAEKYRRVWRGGVEQHPQRRERRHLLHGDVVLTTLDKFLYRFFGFGEERKGYIYPLRMRYGRRPLFCFDEAHSYDDVAFGNFVDLVRAIGFNAQEPRDVIVMTATMPKPYEDELAKNMLEVVDCLKSDEAAPARAFTWRKATSNYHGDDKREAYLDTVVAAVRERHTNAKRTIVVLERVRDAITVYERLSQDGWPDAVLYHGRQTQQQRHEAYGRLIHMEGDRRREADNYLLVTTSAIEVGCDLDAHTLITEICNPDQLIQRAGRCNRRRTMTDAHIVVIGDAVLEDRRTVHSSDVSQYMEILLRMDTAQVFDPHVLLALGHRPHIADYRVRTMFTMLYEYIYEAERANKPLHDKGLVVTRSWEPTVTLATAWDEKDKGPENTLEVGIGSCIAFGEDKLTEGCRVYIRFYDEREQSWKCREPTFGGSAYSADIVVVVPAGYFHETLGYHTTPRVFIAGRRSGYVRQAIYLRKSEQAVGPSQPKSEVTVPAPNATDITSEDPATTEQARKVIWRYLADLPRIEEDENSLEPGSGTAGAEDADDSTATEEEESDE